MKILSIIVVASVSVYAGWWFCMIFRCRKMGLELGSALVDVAVMRAIIKALLGVCGPYGDDEAVALVVQYARASLDRLEAN